MFLQEGQFAKGVAHLTRFYQQIFCSPWLQFITLMGGNNSLAYISVDVIEFVECLMYWVMLTKVSVTKEYM